MSDPAGHDGRRASVAPEIFQRHPDYRVNVVYADGLVNGPSGGHSLALLDAAELQARERFAGRAVGDLPHLAAWRAAYLSFGARPSRFPCSAEALLRRALGGGLPRVSQLVDLYNAISLTHLLPVGGEDRDLLVGDVVLRFADGGETFDTREHGELVTVAVEAGEVIWCDAAGVTCRRWNWRQCARTALTGRVTSAYFVLDALGPGTEGELSAATEALVEGLRLVSPGCESEVVPLRPAP